MHNLISMYVISDLCVYVSMTICKIFCVKLGKFGREIRRCP